MAQPEQQSDTPILARRVGPFSVLIWFVIFVILIAGFLWWRRTKMGTSNTGSNSAVNLTGGGPNGGLTQQSPTMIQWPSDLFVTVKHPVPGASDPPGQQPTDPPANDPPTNTPPPPPAQTTVTYAIKSGDTLSAIASRYGIQWPVLYEANKNTIEARAKQQGLSSSNGGHWIFPGTTLMIPV